MKRAVICTLIISVLAVTGLILYSDTKAVTADVSARLSELAAAPDPALAEDIAEEWEDFCARNIFLTNNECAFEISLILARVSAGISTGEETEDIREDCLNAQKLLAIYERSCSPAPENIF